MTKFEIARWAPDDEGWDIEEGGAGGPGIVLFARAVQVWAVLNAPRLGEASVAAAAAAFNVEPGRVIEAVDWHPWMFLDGPDDDYTRLTIQHEGE